MLIWSLREVLFWGFCPAWIHTAAFLSVWTAPLHTHFGGWLALNPSIPYQIVQKLLGIALHISNFVFWRGSWYKFSFCPYFESCSCTQASIWPQLWPAQGHFPPLGTKAGVSRCHPGCCTHRAHKAASCWCSEFVGGVAPQAAQALWLGEVWCEPVGLELLGKQSEAVLIPVGYVDVFTDHLKSGKLCLQKTQTHSSPDQVLLTRFCHQL